MRVMYIWVINAQKCYQEVLGSRLATLSNQELSSGLDCHATSLAAYGLLEIAIIVDSPPEIDYNWVNFVFMPNVIIIVSFYFC